MNWVEMVISVLFVAVCAMAGALMLMQRANEICREEAAYGLPTGNAASVGAAVGGLAGLLIALLCVYYYLLAAPARGAFQWLGRGSYLLIIGASAAHLTALLHGWTRLQAELREARNARRGPQQGTLLLRRRAALEDLRRSAGNYSDLKAHDDEVVADLIGVLGDRLLVGQRALSRIPFYGYLGTVCGILLMAQELSRLDEATETFKVLRDMSIGLVLAFQTTLVALVTYLPLRKGYDLLLVHLANVERAWLALRDTLPGARE
jgi:hypothetical protein